MKKIAIIDVGSNSVRLLLDGDKTVVNTQLAEFSRDNILQDIPMQRTADGIKSLCERAKGCDIRIFATEAVRSAVNADTFLSLVKNLTGLTVDVLTSEEEARAGFLGAYYGEGKKAILDVGGASAELIVGDSDGMDYSYSLPLGCVRVKDMGLCPPELNGKVAQRVLSYGVTPAFSEFIGIGGTITGLVAIRDKLVPYDRSAVHHSRLTRAEIRKIYERIFATPIEERKNIVGLPEKKIRVIPAGAVLIYEIMSYLNMEEITVSEDDNLEGYAKMRAIDI